MNQQKSISKLDKLSDSALMLDVKDGNVARLGLLYERHKKRLFSFFYNMNSNCELSEDLVQNVFERMLKYKHTFTTESNYIAWMFQIARNINYDYFKKNSKRRYDADIKTVEERINDGDSVEEQIALKEDTSILNKALNMLNKDKKEVLILSKFKELKYKEIGAILGCSEGAARTKAHRAMTDLKVAYLELEKRY